MDVERQRPAFIIKNSSLLLPTHTTIAHQEASPAPAGLGLATRAARSTASPLASWRNSSSDKASMSARPPLAVTVDSCASSFLSWERVTPTRPGAGAAVGLKKGCCSSSCRHPIILNGYSAATSRHADNQWQNGRAPTHQRSVLGEEQPKLMWVLKASDDMHLKLPSHLPHPPPPPPHQHMRLLQHAVTVTRQSGQVQNGSGG